MSSRWEHETSIKQLTSDVNDLAEALRVGRDEVDDDLGADLLFGCARLMGALVHQFDYADRPSARLDACADAGGAVPA